MTYRTRLTLAFLVCTLVPLLVLGYVVQRETRTRLASQFDDRVRALATSVSDAFATENANLDVALEGIGSVIAGDNRFRAAVAAGADDRRYILDYAGDAMARAGLDALLILDAEERIVSSGHFRNDFDRIDHAFEPFVESGAGAAGTPQTAITLAAMRQASGSFLAIVRARAVRVGDVELTLVGGRRVDADYLARLSSDPALTVEIAGLPDEFASQQIGASTQGSHVVGYEFAAVFMDADGVAADPRAVDIRIQHDATPLGRLVADLNRWFLFVVGAAALVAFVVSLWLARLMSEPLVDLARRTERIDMTKLTESFHTSRTDEVGLLSRRLGEMTRRLRASAKAIREAERRAAIGDIARQVNHDIRNGLAPIRNVVRHLSQLASDDPAALPDVFRQRQGTLDSSVGYLEDLASQYARLSPRKVEEKCDVGAITRQVVSDLADSTAAVNVVAVERATILGDPVSVRRLVENLVRNALQSGDPSSGRDRSEREQTLPLLVDVSVLTETVGSDGAIVRLVVADNGRGMPDETVAHIFDDFFTTRPEGTGLGLSIVRRIAMDLQGSVSVESQPGKGSTFTVEFPLCR